MSSDTSKKQPDGISTGPTLATTSAAATSSPGPGLSEEQQAPKALFGKLFEKFSEAVGATKELLYDGDLRRKAVPFVLAEGGKALQELQKGLTRNAAALGRQLQNSAAGQFPTYIGRLLERSAYSRQRGRAEQYNQPVSVWVGAQPCHDMQHEIRTRFWFILLENPHIIALLKPICSQTLFSLASTVHSSNGMASNTNPLVAGAPDSPGASDEASTEALEGPEGTGPVSAGGQEGAARATLVEETEEPSVGRVDSEQELQGADLDQPSSRPLSPVGLPEAEGGAEPVPITSDSTSISPETIADTSINTAAADTITPARSSSPELSALPTTPLLPVDSGHAEEDDVLSMLEAAQQSRQVAAMPAAAQSGRASELRPALSGLLKKVARVVDKGRRSSGRDTPESTPDDTSLPPSQRVSAANAPHPPLPTPASQRTSAANAVQPPSPAPQRVGPASASGAMLSVLSGQDGEWEMLDSPQDSSDAQEATSTTDAVQRLQNELAESRARSSPLEQVWSLLLSVPWDQGRGLVLDVREDCRYLTLNEMTAGQEEVDDVIMRDIHRTFPEHPLFSDLEGQMALFRLLKAYSLHDLEVGYCQGMAFMAGVMLMYLPEEPAFRLYCQIMGDEGPNLRRLYLPGLNELKSELARFELLLATTQPELQAHLEAFGIPPVLYVSQWLMTVYASPFPPSFCAELIDIMMQDGHDAIMMRCALLIMDELAPALLQLHDFEHLLTYIKVTPMEWDTLHLRQVLGQAVTRTWCGAPEAPGALRPQPSLTIGPRASAEGQLSGGPSGVLADLNHHRLLSLDAEELQLDQEIAQMVRELKLKVPHNPAHVNAFL